MVHYVTDGAHKARVHYSAGRCYNGKMSVTLYAQNFRSDLGKIFPGHYKNDTDSQSDYYDQGRVEIYEDHPLYAAAIARSEENSRRWAAHRAKVEAKRATRRAARMGVA
jgi:hypothetical protein